MGERNSREYREMIGKVHAEAVEAARDAASEDTGRMPAALVELGFDPDRDDWGGYRDNGSSVAWAFDGSSLVVAPLEGGDGVLNLDGRPMTEAFGISWDGAEYDGNAEVSFARGVHAVGSMSHAFDYTTPVNVTGVDFNNLDTHGVTDMSDMFKFMEGCEGIDMSMLDTSNVTDMHRMFEDEFLPFIDMHGLDLSRVRDASDMFDSDGRHTIHADGGVDMSGTHMDSVEDVTRMFADLDIGETDQCVIRLPELMNPDAGGYGSMFDFNEVVPVMNMGMFRMLSDKCEEVALEYGEPVYRYTHDRDNGGGEYIGDSDDFYVYDIGDVDGYDRLGIDVAGASEADFAEMRDLIVIGGVSLDGIEDVGEIGTETMLCVRVPFDLSADGNAIVHVYGKDIFDDPSEDGKFAFAVDARDGFAVEAPFWNEQDLGDDVDVVHRKLATDYVYNDDCNGFVAKEPDDSIFKITGSALNAHVQAGIVKMLEGKVGVRELLPGDGLDWDDVYDLGAFAEETPDGVRFDFEDAADAYGFDDGGFDDDNRDPHVYDSDGDNVIGYD